MEGGENKIPFFGWQELFPLSVSTPSKFVRPKEKFSDISGIIALFSLSLLGLFKALGLRIGWVQKRSIKIWLLEMWKMSLMQLDQSSFRSEYEK